MNRPQSIENQGPEPARHHVASVVTLAPDSSDDSAIPSIAGRRASLKDLPVELQLYWLAAPRRLDR